MHKPESVKVNEKHKILEDFEMTDHLIPARIQDLVIITPPPKKKQKKKKELFVQ